MFCFCFDRLCLDIGLLLFILPGIWCLCLVSKGSCIFWLLIYYITFPWFLFCPFVVGFHFNIIHPQLQLSSCPPWIILIKPLRILLPAIFNITIKSRAQNETAQAGILAPTLTSWHTWSKFLSLFLFSQSKICTTIIEHVCGVPGRIKGVIAY